MEKIAEAKRIEEENKRIKEWEKKFDEEQKKKEDELIRRFYSDEKKVSQPSEISEVDSQNIEESSEKKN